MYLWRSRSSDLSSWWQNISEGHGLYGEGRIVGMIQIFKNKTRSFRLNHFLRRNDLVYVLFKFKIVTNSFLRINLFKHLIICYTTFQSDKYCIIFSLYSLIFIISQLLYLIFKHFLFVSKICFSTSSDTIIKKLELTFLPSFNSC